MYTLSFKIIIFIFLLSNYTSYMQTHEILHFNPHLSYIPPAQYSHKTPVVTAIGFPDPAMMYHHKFDTEKTFTVTFSFHHNLLYCGYVHPCNVLNAIHSINLGQKEDAKVLLHAVLQCYHKGYTKIDIFANSRGGAATITMLDILSNPEHYHDIWSSFGILDHAIHDALRAMIAKGTIFLAHPLIDQHATIQYFTQHPFNMLFDFPGKNSCKKALTWYACIIMTMLTSYQNNFSSPLKILKNNMGAVQWPYHIYIASADCDPIVGTDHRTVLHELSIKYPSKLKLIRGGAHHNDIKKLVKHFRDYLQNSTPLCNVHKNSDLSI